MGNLTIKQEKFCIEYVRTGNAIQSYKAIYKPKGNESTITNDVNDLLKNPKISPRIAELKAPIIEKAQITLKWHIDRYLDLYEKAMEKGNIYLAYKIQQSIGADSGICKQPEKKDEMILKLSPELESILKKAME